jgi:hypothetical protein
MALDTRFARCGVQWSHLGKNSTVKSMLASIKIRLYTSDIHVATPA